MKNKRKSKPARIHVHLYKGVVDSVEPKDLREPVELWIHDHDVMFPGDIPGKDISIYRLEPKSKKKDAIRGWTQRHKGRQGHRSRLTSSEVVEAVEPARCACVRACERP